MSESNSSTPAGAIYTAIPRVMAEIGAIGKDRRNEMQKYSFRGIDDIYNCVQPALVKHGVFVLPEVIEQRREERTNKNGTTLLYTILTVRHRFVAQDGSHVACVTVGEAMDSGDKSANKAMSAAMKYAILETFCIPTEGDNDTENSSHELQSRRAVSVSVAGPVMAAPAPVSAPTAEGGMTYYAYTTAAPYKIPAALLDATAGERLAECPWGKSKGKPWAEITEASLKGLWGVARDIISSPIGDDSRKQKAVVVLKEIDHALVAKYGCGQRLNVAITNNQPTTEKN